MKQKKITVGYSRIPETRRYKVTMETFEIDQGAPENTPNPLLKWTANGVLMEDIIRELHWTLQRHPDAAVTLIQKPPRDLIFKRPPKSFDLDKNLISQIRDDPSEAMKMFEPIKRVVNVGPPRVSVRLKEDDDGNQAEK